MSASGGHDRSTRRAGRQQHRQAGSLRGHCAVTTGHEQPVCWICYERAFAAEAGAHSAGPLLRACACRGPDASFSHLPCLVKYAGTNDTASKGKSWWQCPTCKQNYTGALKLGLAQAQWELVRGRGLEDHGRYLAANSFAVALHDAGDYNGALPLSEEALVVARRMKGDDHPNTLSSISNLATLHTDIGNHHLALSLHTEALAGSRRLLGDAHPDTLSSICNIAALHSDMGNHDLALPLYEEAVAGSRRVLGNAHPETLIFIGNMAVLRNDMGEHAAAAALMREALAGRRRVLGEDHPSTQAAIAMMDMIEEYVAADLVGLAAEEGKQEQEEEETMYQRLAKRRRRA
jgi:tetratricopeptide (TPR) repeat protein